MWLCSAQIRIRAQNSRRLQGTHILLPSASTTARPSRSLMPHQRQATVDLLPAVRASAHFEHPSPTRRRITPTVVLRHSRTGRARPSASRPRSRVRMRASSGPPRTHAVPPRLRPAPLSLRRTLSARPLRRRRSWPAGSSPARQHCPAHTPLPHGCTLCCLATNPHAAGAPPISCGACAPGQAWRCEPQNVPLHARDDPARVCASVPTCYTCHVKATKRTVSDSVSDAGLIAALNGAGGDMERSGTAGTNAATVQSCVDARNVSNALHLSLR